MKKIFFLLSIFAFSAYLQAGNGKYRFMIGTYTSNTNSEGIYSIEIDPDKNEQIITSQYSDIVNPSFLSVEKRNLYAVSQQNDSSFVYAFDFNKRNANLRFLNRQSSAGAGSCHVDASPDNVVVANYSGGNLAIFGREKNGSITKHLQVITHTGNSIDSARQTKPHVHQTIFSPDNKFLLVNDLGTDKMTCYQYNPKSKGNVLTLSDEIKLKAGSGPRHLAFSKNGKYIYVLQELDGTISSLAFNKGKLTLLSESSVLQQNESGAAAADIHLSPDGKHLYATNRGAANNISCFAVEKNGSLRFIEQTSVKGSGPRNFCITKDGKYLLVGNMYTNQIAVFSRNKQTGMLFDTGMMINIPSPVCIIEF